MVIIHTIISSLFLTPEKDVAMFAQLPNMNSIENLDINLDLFCLL